MKTNEELIKKYKLMEYMNNAFIYMDKLESYKTNLNNALDELRAESYNKAIAEQDGRYKIHEKYHELNDKDIEDKAYMQGYKEGIAHCERRDNNPIFNWYVKEYLKEEFLHLDSGLLLQEPIKVFADKLRLEGYKQGHIDTLKKLEHSIKNMYKDATSGENGGTADQAGLARALGLIKSEIKKR